MLTVAEDRLSTVSSVVALTVPKTICFQIHLGRDQPDRVMLWVDISQCQSAVVGTPFGMDAADDLIRRNRNLLALATAARAQYRELNARVGAGVAAARQRQEYWRQQRQAVLSRPGGIYGPPFGYYRQTND